MPDQPRVVQGLVINAPEWFKDPGFVAYLNGPKVMTWHEGGEPDEWSDTVVLVDPGLTGQGPDADVIPEPIWTAIVQACIDAGIGGDPRSDHLPVRITNIAG